MLLIDGLFDVDLWGCEVFYIEDGVIKVGCLILGGWGVVFNKLVGMGYVCFDLVQFGICLKVCMQCQFWDVVVIEDSFYDLENKVICVDG